MIILAVVLRTGSGRGRSGEGFEQVVGEFQGGRWLEMLRPVEIYTTFEREKKKSGRFVAMAGLSRLVQSSASGEKQQQQSLLSNQSFFLKLEQTKAGAALKLTGLSLLVFHVEGSKFEGDDGDAPD